MGFPDRARPMGGCGVSIGSLPNGAILRNASIGVCGDPVGAQSSDIAQGGDDDILPPVASGPMSGDDDSPHEAVIGLGGRGRSSGCQPQESEDTDQRSTIDNQRDEILNGGWVGIGQKRSVVQALGISDWGQSIN